MFVNHFNHFLNCKQLAKYLIVSGKQA